MRFAGSPHPTALYPAPVHGVQFGRKIGDCGLFKLRMLVNGIPGNTISIRDRGLLYGDGVFRTLRAEQGKALHWPLHYLKLQHDCAKLGIACPDEALLCAELDQVLAQHPDGVVKLIVTRGEGARGYTPSLDVTPTRIGGFSPLPD